MSDDFLKIIFPIIRREVIPDPYAGERCCYEPGICMRWGCGLPRWHNPEKGGTVLCEEHAEEVRQKKAKAPPLTPIRDYQSTLRPALFTDFTKGPEKP